MLAALLFSSAAIANDTNYFAGASLGYSDVNVNQNDQLNSIILGNKIDENGYNIAIEGGYHYCDKIDFTLNYQRVVLNDVYLNNVYASTQYKFDKIWKYIPYAGVNLGLSQLHWSKKPLNTINNDYYSSSYLIGVSAGLLFPLENNFTLKIDYQLNHMDHTTNIDDPSAKSEILHGISNHVSIGLRYDFNL